MTMHVNYTITKKNGKFQSVDSFELIADNAEEVDVLSFLRLQLYYGDIGKQFRYNGPIEPNEVTGEVKGIQFATLNQVNMERRSLGQIELPV